MKQKRYTDEQAIKLMRKIEASLDEGTSVEQACKAGGVAPGTFYRWRRLFGGLQDTQIKRLRELERENRRLKKIVANQALDADILKEALKVKI